MLLFWLGFVIQVDHVRLLPKREIRKQLLLTKFTAYLIIVLRYNIGLETKHRERGERLNPVPVFVLSTTMIVVYIFGF